MKTTWRTEGPYIGEAQSPKELTAVEVVSVYGDHVADTTVEHADVIRAAPEMLKALKEIVAAHDHFATHGTYPEGTVGPNEKFSNWVTALAESVIDVAENGCPVQRTMVAEVCGSFPSTITYAGLVTRLGAGIEDTVFVGAQFMDLIRRGRLRVNDMGVVFSNSLVPRKGSR
jgi:hypothetical protein